MKLLIFIGLLLFLLQFTRNQNPMNEDKTMSTKYRMRKRTFVNRDPSYTAAVVAIVEDTSHRNGSDTENWNYGVIELSLTDCYKKVSYDFYLSDRIGRASALYKAKKLAAVLNEFVEALEAEVNSIEARKSRAKSKSAAA